MFKIQMGVNERVYPVLKHVCYPLRLRAVQQERKSHNLTHIKSSEQQIPESMCNVLLYLSTYRLFTVRDKFQLRQI